MRLRNKILLFVLMSIFVVLNLTSCVAKDKAVRIGFDSDSYAVKINEVLDIDINIEPGSDYSEANIASQLLYYSSDESVATFVNGKLTGVGYGETTIKVEWSEKAIVFDRAKVYVGLGDLPTIEFGEDFKYVMDKTTSQDFDYSLSFENEHVDVSWVELNPTVACIENGKIKALQAGEAQFKAVITDGIFTEEQLVTIKVLETDFTINYVLNDGVNSEDNPNGYSTLLTPIALADATRVGYTFKGWYLNDQLVTELSVGTTGNVTLVAKWEIIDYNITYTLDGGTHENQATYTVLDAIVLKDATKAGYTFKGWYSEGNKIEKIEVGTTGDLALTAEFEIIEYTITYENNGGEHSNVTKYTILEEVELAQATKAGYDFKGWYNGEEKVEKIELGSTGNLTLTAKFEPTKYTITYNLNGGTHSNVSEYTVLDQIILSDAVKPGYTFTGWYKDEAKVEKIEAGTTGEITLTAMYEIITYTITYDFDGGVIAGVYASREEMVNDFMNDFGTFAGITMTTPAQYWSHSSKTAFWKDATMRAKWAWMPATLAKYAKAQGQDDQYLKALASLDGTVSSYATQNVAIYLLGINNAIWNSDYKATYNGLSSKWTTVDCTSESIQADYPKQVNEYTVNSTVNLPSAKKAHYEFEGWYDGTNKVTTIAAGSTGNKTLVAKYTPVEYTITYDVDGGVLGDNPTTYNIETEKELGVATKDRYNFVGWYLGDVKVEKIALGTTGNITLKAHYELCPITTTTKGFNTLDEAIAGSSEGDVISISAGTYTLGVVINKSLEFVGVSRDSVTINVAKDKAGNINGDRIVFENVTLVGAGGGSVSGVTFQNGASAHYLEFNNCVIKETNTLIKFTSNTTKAIDIVITNCEISRIGQFAVWVTKGLNTLTVTDSTIDASSCGAVTNAAAALFRIRIGEAFFYNNVFIGDTQNIDGLFESGVSSTGVTVKYNTFKNVYKFVHINDGKKVLFDENLYLYDDVPATSAPSAVTGNGVVADVEVASDEADRAERYRIFLLRAPLTFVIGEDAVLEDAPKYYLQTEGMETLPTPTREHYTFEGWLLDGEKVTSISAEATGPITLTASWKPVDYTITYTTDGSNDNPTTYNYESNITLNVSQKTGYKFVGWFNGEEQVTTIGPKAHGDITLVAKFEIEEYKITYNLNGGMPAGIYPSREEMVVDFLRDFGKFANTTLTTPAEYWSSPEKTNFFKDPVYRAKWAWMFATLSAVASKQSIDTQYLDAMVDPEGVISGYATQNVAIYLLGINATIWNTDYISYGSLASKWTVVDCSSLEVKNNFPGLTLTYTILDKVELPILNKDGYKFLGWYINNVKVTEIALGSTGNVQVVAKFEEIGTYVESPIEYVLDGGVLEADAPVKYYEGKGLGSLPSATKDGYKFLGWFVEDVKVEEISKTQVGKVVLTAKWEESAPVAVESEIEYVLDGGVNEPEAAVKYTEGVGLATLPTPTKDGYKFLGWYIEDVKVESISTEVTGKVVLTAKWEQNAPVAVESEIEYVLDGGVNEPEAAVKYTEGVGLATLPTPTKDGYKFLGWYIEDVKVESISTEVTGKVVLTAKWELDAPVVVKDIMIGNKGFDTLDEAVNAAEEGDVIKLSTGEYTLGVVINKSLEFVGASRSSVIVNVTKDKSGNINGDRVVFKSLTIKGAGGGAGISGVTFQSNTATHYVEFNDCLLTETNTLIKFQATATNKIDIVATNCEFTKIGQFAFWVTNSINTITVTDCKVNASTCGAIVNGAASLFRIRNGEAFFYNNEFIGDDIDIDGLFESGDKATKVTVKYNIFRNVTKFVHINTVHKPIEFDENLYLDGDTPLTTVPSTVSGNGVTSDATLAADEQDRANRYALFLDPTMNYTYSIGKVGYDSFAEALAAAVENDTIVVKNAVIEGDYDITVNGLTILGPKANTEISPKAEQFKAAKLESNAVFTGKISINANNVTLNGINLGSGALVRLGEVSNTTIKSVHSNSAGALVQASGGRNAVIGSVSTVNGLTILDSTFVVDTASATGRNAIAFYGVLKDLTVRNSSFTHTYKGTISGSVYNEAIRVQEASGVYVIEDNIFAYPTDNYAIMIGGGSNNCTKIDIKHNLFTGVEDDTYDLITCGLYVQQLPANSVLNIIANEFVNAAGSTYNFGKGKADSLINIELNHYHGNTAFKLTNANAGSGTIRFANNYYETPISEANQVVPTDKDILADFASYKVLLDEYLSSPAALPHHQLVLVLDGGVLEVVPTEYIEGELFALPVPTKEGYKFLGWSAVEGSDEYVTVIPVTANTKLTYYANYEKVIVNSVLTLNLDGGSLATQVDTYVEGEEFVLPIPSKLGFDFLGWGLTADATTYVTKIEATQKGEVVLYAIWNEISSTFNVTYVLNGGNALYKNREELVTDLLADLNSVTGKSITKSNFTAECRQVEFEKFIKDEAMWKKWKFLFEFFKSINPNSNSPVIYDEVLTSRTCSGTLWWFLTRDFAGFVNGTIANFYYSVGPIDFTVFANGDGFWDKVQTTNINHPAEKISTILVPYRPFYTFVGWYENSDFTGDVVTTLSKDCTLYAKWEKNYAVVTYNLDNNEASLTNTTVKIYPSDTLTLETPTFNSKYWKFNGWFADEAFTLPISKVDEYTLENVTVYASWTEILGYTINYNLNGGSIKYASREELINDFFNDYNVANNKGYSKISDIKVGNFEDIDFHSFYGKVLPDGTNMRTKWLWLAEYLLELSKRDLPSNNCNVLGLDCLVNQKAYSGDGTYGVSYAFRAFLFGRTIRPNSSYSSVDHSVYENANGFWNKLSAAEQTEYLNNKDEVTLPECHLENYKFVGWYLNPDFSGEVVTKTTDTGSAWTLYAKFVEATPVESVSISNKITEMKAYSTHQLTWVINPNDANIQSVKFVSSDNKIATVDSNGLISAISTGTVTITMISLAPSQKSDSITIDVYSPDHFEVSYETESYGKVGENLKLIAEYVKRDSSASTYTWTSLNPEIASVENGVVTLIAVGNATIRVSVSEEVYFDFVVTVVDNTVSEALQSVLDSHNSNPYVRYELGIGAGTPAYYRDIIGSVSKRIYNKEFEINRTHEATQAGNSENHGGTKTSTEFITVHYTGNMSPKANANANASYFASTNATSIHYTTGNDGVFHILDDSLIAFHAGDKTDVPFEWIETGVDYNATDPKYPVWGISANSKFTINGVETTVSVPAGTTPATAKVTGNTFVYNGVTQNCINDMGLPFKVADGKYYMGTTWWCYTQIAAGRICSKGGNLNSIGIESCVNPDSDLWLTWHYTAQLVARLMLENNLDITRVRGHHFFSAKDCPQPLLENDLEIWNIFIKMVEEEYRLITTLKDAKYEMTVNEEDKAIVSDYGRITPSEYAKTVTYTVKVTVGGSSETITLATAVNGIYSECGCK